MTRADAINVTIPSLGVADRRRHRQPKRGARFPAWWPTCRPAGPKQTERSATENTYIARAVEASINIGLVALLAAVCLLILAPFVPIIAWGIIIAVASYPTLGRLQIALQGRGGWAAAIWTVLLLAVLIVPVVLLATSTVEGARSLAGADEGRNLRRSASPA